MLGKNLPWRNKKYIDWIMTQPCVITQMDAEAPHHIKGHGQGGSTKASDLFTFPLVNMYHTGDHGIHTYGYPKWEKIFGNQWIFVIDTIHKAIAAGIVKREFVIEEIKAQVKHEEELEMLLEEFSL